MELRMWKSVDSCDDGMNREKSRLGIRKSVQGKALGIGVTDAMQKSLNTGRLVRKQVDVNRGGRTFKQNKWVRPDEAGGSMPGAGTKDNPPEVKPNRQKITVGQTIGYTANGQNYNGTVSQTGFVDGVIVKDERGREHPVEWKNIRDPKNAGSGGNGSDGEDGNGGGERMFSKTDFVKQLFDHAAIKPGFRDGTQGKQPFTKIDDMYKMCSAARDDFLQMSKAVKEKFASINPQLITRPELKKVERVKEKIKADGDYDEETGEYDASSMRDVDGHTFCVKDIGQLSELLHYYDKEDKSVIRIKNNFAKPSPVGYSDINMNVRLPNGTVAEVQINTIANIVAKEKYGHAMYEVYRSIERNPKYAELANILAEGQKVLYAMSNKYSKEGNFPDIGDKNPFFQVEHKEYGDAIREHIAKAAVHFERAKADGVLDTKTVDHFEHLINMVGA